MQTDSMFSEHLKREIEKQNRFYEFSLLMQELNKKTLKPIVSFEKSIEPINRLYCYKTRTTREYFHNEEKLLEYFKTHSFSPENIYIIDYIGQYGNKIDVIRIVNKRNVILVSDLNHKYHFEYNMFESEFINEHCWIKEEGSIHEIINEFKEIGQEFEQDNINIQNLYVLKLLNNYNRKK